MIWLRRLHAWIGLGLCLVLAVIALSGTVLLFKDDARRVLHPTTPTPPTAERLAGVLRAAEAEVGQGKIRSIIFASPAVTRHEATLKGGGGVSLDGQGRVVDRWGKNERPFDILFDIHHHLMLGDLGTDITGWVGVIALLMTLSGLVLWWPARGSFRGRAIPMRNSRAGWLAAHRDLAVMTAPLVILLLMTGAPVALADLVRPLMNAAPIKAPKARTEGPVDWTAALAAAQAKFPDGILRMASVPGRAGAPVTVRVRQPSEWHVNGRTMVYLEPATGAVIGVNDDRVQTTGTKLYNVLWPIHAAKIGGPIWKAGIFLGGLSLTLLALYGGESYRRRLFDGRRRPAWATGIAPK